MDGDEVMLASMLLRDMNCCKLGMKEATGSGKVWRAMECNNTGTTDVPLADTD